MGRHAALTELVRDIGPGLIGTSRSRRKFGVVVRDVMFVLLTLALFGLLALCVTGAQRL